MGSATKIFVIIFLINYKNHAFKAHHILDAYAGYKKLRVNLEKKSRQAHYFLYKEVKIYKKKKNLGGHEIKKWSKSTFFDLWILTKNFIKFFPFIYIYIYDFFFQQKTKKIIKKIGPIPIINGAKNRFFFFMSGIKNGRISTI